MSLPIPSAKWLEGDPEILICDSPKKNLSEFRAQVAACRSRLLEVGCDKLSICSESPYRFAAMLLGCLAAGKTPVLFPKNSLLREELEQEVPFRADDSFYESLKFNGRDEVSAPVVINPESRLFLYTSGSTGKPKRIVKSLREMDLEAVQTARFFVSLPKDSVVRMTVDAEHQYGLTFGIWMPLSLRLPLPSARTRFPEDLSSGAGPVILISTPSFLANLDPSLSYHEVLFVLSAGGPLSQKAVDRVRSAFGLETHEIYGSTEAGVIAWKSSDNGRLTQVWELFPDYSISGDSLSSEGRLPAPLKLEDVLDRRDDRHFVLLGRSDQIIKVGEERISMLSLENKISEALGCPVKALKTERDGRPFIAAFLERTDAEDCRLRAGEIKEIRRTLSAFLPPLAVPRIWRQVSEFPRNNQGKILVGDLRRILNE